MRSIVHVKLVLCSVVHVTLVQCSVLYTWG